MKTYRRILVPLFSGSQNDILLHRATELAQGPRTQMLVLRVLDTRSGFEPDGPVPALPGETASRRAPDVKRKLELQLARNNLGWAEAKVVWGDTKAVLADVIRSWEPDLVVACAGQLPYGVLEDADVLKVNRRSLFRRLAEALHHPAPRHA